MKYRPELPEPVCQKLRFFGSILLILAIGFSFTYFSMPTTAASKQALVFSSSVTPEQEGVYMISILIGLMGAFCIGAGYYFDPTRSK